jgi:PAS domain S-box-containing protein
MWKQLRLHSVSYFLACAVFVLVAGFGIAGYLYYADEKEEAKQLTYLQISAIAQLKTDEISRWREERLADAYIIMKTPFIGRLVQQCFKRPDESLSVQEVYKWMSAYKDRFDYSSVSLLDPAGNIRFSLPEGERSNAHLRRLVSEAVDSKEPILGDLERAETVNDIHLDLVVPLFDADESGDASVGAVLIRINPNRFLYPLIQSWPTPSLSAESLLVRREGNEVVYLNELRHRENTALSLRLPINDRNAPCVMAAKGHEGAVDGVDYRGSYVLSVVKRIPETPWFLIAKIDAKEIYAPVHEHVTLTIIVAGLLLGGVGMTLLLIWSHQKSKLYLKQYKTEAEKLELAKRYEHLARNANDIILLVDADGKVVEGNQRALTAYGYPTYELIGLNVRNLETPEASPMLEERMRLAVVQDGFVFETRHRRKQGAEFPVEVSARAVEQMGKSLFMMIIRDITERKHAEESLREAHNSLERRVEQRTSELVAINERLKQEMEMRIKAEKEYRSVTVRLAETEESERRRVARELHDRVGQSLTALNFSITTVMNRLPADSPPDVANRLEDSLNLVSDTMSSVRNLMSELRPPLLDDHGLAAVLRWYCREFSERSGIPTVVKCEETIPRLPPSEEIALFRIAQEALVNVLRHARASQVTAELEATAEAVRMTISDNGAGFVPETVRSARTESSGWGMLSMRERAEMVGGGFQVFSSLGGGTRIVVEVKR